MEEREKLLISTQIVKDCFWDYSITDKEVLGIIESGDFEVKKKVFIKIIKNSTAKVDALRLFKKNELKKLFEDLPPELKESEKVKILENCFFDENHRISRYEWRKYQ
ncbi:MAG TPA: hypothetical protein PLX16_00590 [Exilispira sp.]|nr:hypothetical protein [Exilispira sp.]